MIERFKQFLRVQKLRSWYKAYERYIVPGALLAGFLSDLIMFRYVNVRVVLAALSVHLALAGAAIALLNLHEAQKLKSKLLQYAQIFSPMVLQFSFGSLFSAFVLFYSASGSLAASWPFLLALVFLMVGNELFKKQYMRPLVQISAYFFSLFAFANWAIPYTFRELGPMTFLASGLSSVVVILLFFHYLRRAAPRLQEYKRGMFAIVAAIFLAMNVLYFANVIPPIPLVIKDIGVYHNIQRTGDTYQIFGEEQSRNALLPLQKKFTLTPADSTAYVFSSVFSPSHLDIDVTHEWQKRDTVTDKWITVNSVSFPLVGGREEGFRGYSWKTNMQPGMWRVNVKTANGQVIGRIAFLAVESDELPPLNVIVK